MPAPKHSICCYITAFALIALVTASVQAQTIWYVDDNAPNDPGPGDPTVSDPAEDGSAEHPFDAIKEGIDATSNSDEVIVLDGTYTGQGNRNLDFGGKAITVHSQNGPEATIIDCQEDGRCFYFHSDENADSVVEGFTITNGYCYNHNHSGDSGGGIYCYESSPTIVNNTITGNSTDGGGGISCSYSSPTIANNIIMGNIACTDGGGIYCSSNSSPMITNNTIAGNIAFGIGGGICCKESSPMIANNTITANSARSGGGIYCDDSSPAIANSTITGNGADYGGGVCCYESSPTITNNTITGNSATYYGGGVCCLYSSPTTTNNTITANSADYGGGIYCYKSSPAIANTIVAFNYSGIYASAGSPVLRHNCVYGNTAYNYSTGITDPTGTDGNICQDPKLASVEYGNVHIQPDSPCKDTGDNNYAYGDFDMDGEPRIQPEDGAVDIGADESDGTIWPAGPYVIVRVSPSGDDANDGSSWALAKRTVQAGLDAASALGGEVWVQAGTYYERITLHLYAHVYGGFAGTEAERDERDWTANVTTLDGQQGGSVVTAFAGYALSTIDGFTISNGNADSGGGVCCYESSPAIANNTITGNSADDGGGVCCYDSSPTIANNTITGNSASYRGGGICCFFDSSPTIVNTIVAFNSSGIYKTGSDTLTLQYNCVYGNTDYNYSGITDPTGTEGNISADPLFVDKDGGDYHLAAGSPCIDAGDNSSVPAGLTMDLDGSPRFIDDPATPDCQWAPGTCGTPPIVDMGAYEFQPTPRIIHIYQDNGAVRDGVENINPDGPGSIEARTKGITVCKIEFSEDVNIQASDVQIRDVNDSIDLTWPSNFNYDAGTHTLTMEWPTGTFKNMWVRIHILDTVTSVATGLNLDGELSGLCGSLPSGDGVPGGDAQFVIGALQGDVDGNRIVNSFDRLRVSQNQGITADIPSDVDGNGIVNSFDGLRTNQNQGASLPQP